MFREIPCIGFAFFWSLLPQRQTIPQSHRTTAEVSRHLTRRKGNDFLYEELQFHKQEDKSPLLLFLTGLLLLASAQSQKVHSRARETQSCISGWRTAKEGLRESEIVREIAERRELREFITKWYINIWSHLWTVNHVSDPKQHANSFEIWTLERMIAQVPDWAMEYTHMGQIQMTRKRFWKLNYC